MDTLTSAERSTRMALVRAKDIKPQLLVCRLVLASLPTSRGDFWLSRLTTNAERDVRNLRALRQLGWNLLKIWKCQLGDTAKLISRTRKFLDAQR